MQTSLGGIWRVFTKLPDIFSHDILEFSLKNQLRFFYDMKQTQKESIGVLPLQEITDSRNTDFNFIFENVWKFWKWEIGIGNFSDVLCSIKNDQPIFEIITNLNISSLTCITAAVIPNTLKIFFQSVEQIIICIVSVNKKQYLNKLKSYLTQRGHVKEILDLHL